MYYILFIIVYIIYIYIAHYFYHAKWKFIELKGPCSRAMSNSRCYVQSDKTMQHMRMYLFCRCVQCQKHIQYVRKSEHQDNPSILVEWGDW